MFQVGYFVGGVASLESSEIAGIAVSFSFVAILVLIFVVIFVARHRFNRGMGIGGGGDCARRWRHEKPNGGATVEKINGSVHVSFVLPFGCVKSGLNSSRKSFDTKDNPY